MQRRPLHGAFSLATATRGLVSAQARSQAYCEWVLISITLIKLCFDSVQTVETLHMIEGILCDYN